MTSRVPSSRNIPGLDGLRALSITLVVMAHAENTAGLPAYPTWLWHFGELGLLGVRVFFVISGFLITHLLLREEARAGTISIRGFYMRRAFRILPALWVFLFAVIVLRQAGVVAFPLRQWLQGLLFTANYYTASGPAIGWVLGHLWSLAVEEQFYFVWPALLVFAPRRMRTGLLLTALVAAPIIRLGLWAGMAGAARAGHNIPLAGFFSAMDALAIGCLLAIWRANPSMPSWYRRVVSGRWIIVTPVLLLVLNGLNDNPWIYLALIIPLMNFTVAVMVETASRGSLLGWQQLLDLPAVQWLGRLSYSLYLWQQVFLNRNSTQSFTRFPWNVCLALTAAAASYFFIERPALARRPPLAFSPMPDPSPLQVPAA